MSLGQLDLVCIGNLVADVIVRSVDVLPPVGQLGLVDAIDLRGGGGGFTTASAMARLGGRTALFGMVGDDDFGRYLVELLEPLGVDCQNVTTLVGYATASTAVIVNTAGQRTYLHAPGVNAFLSVEHLNLAVLFSSRALHIAGALINPRLDGEPSATILAEAQRRGMHTSLDTSWDSTGQWQRILPALPHLDVFAPSWDEAHAITGENDPAHIVGWLRDHGARTVVVKLGADGAYADGMGFRGHVPAYPVTAVDSTGAGESFNAGLIYGILAGWTLERSTRLGAAVGALAVSAVGAADGITGLPDAMALAGLTS